MPVNALLRYGLACLVAVTLSGCGLLIAPWVPASQSTSIGKGVMSNGTLSLLLLDRFARPEVNLNLGPPRWHPVRNDVYLATFGLPPRVAVGGNYHATELKQLRIARGDEWMGVFPDALSPSDEPHGILEQSVHLSSRRTGFYYFDFLSRTRSTLGIYPFDTSLSYAYNAALGLFYSYPNAHTVEVHDRTGRLVRIRNVAEDVSTCRQAFGDNGREYLIRDDGSEGNYSLRIIDLVNGTAQTVKTHGRALAYRAGRLYLFAFQGKYPEQSAYASVYDISTKESASWTLPSFARHFGSMIPSLWVFDIDNGRMLFVDNLTTDGKPATRQSLNGLAWYYETGETARFTLDCGSREPVKVDRSCVFIDGAERAVNLD